MLAKVIPGLPEVPTAIVVIVGATLCGLLNIRVNALGSARWPGGGQAAPITAPIACRCPQSPRS